MNIINESGRSASVFINIETIHCSSCGLLFAIDSEWIARRRADHLTWYCPNGHSQHWPGKSEVEKLRAEKEALEERLQSERKSKEHFQQKYAAKERSLIATQGHLTRKRKELNRVKNGVCPCCNRNFLNLKNHMQNKHPEFQQEQSI